MYFLIVLLAVNMSVCAFDNAPNIIDFGKLQTASDKDHNTRDPWRWQQGQLAFNFAPELQSIFVYMKDRFGLDTAIETGTYRGNTTVFFGLLFDNVHTIEIDKNTYTQTKNRIGSSGFNNIVCHLGSSEKVLKDILPSLQGKKVLIYLDAHWGKYCPLNDELKVIASTHKDNCVVVIDDVN